MLTMSTEKISTSRNQTTIIITDTLGSSFDKIAVDIVRPLPNTKKDNEYILTLQDQLSSG